MRIDKNLSCFKNRCAFYGLGYSVPCYDRSKNRRAFAGSVACLTHFRYLDVRGDLRNKDDVKDDVLEETNRRTGEGQMKNLSNALNNNPELGRFLEYVDKINTDVALHGCANFDPSFVFLMRDTANGIRALLVERT
jgi:hypothetical protein